MYAVHLKNQPKGKTAAAAAVAKPWTDDELLLLLEALEMYKVLVIFITFLAYF